MTKNDCVEYASGWDTDDAARSYSTAVFASLTEIATGCALDPLGARVLNAKAATRAWSEVEMSQELPDAVPAFDLVGFDYTQKEVSKVERRTHR